MVSSFATDAQGTGIGNRRATLRLDGVDAPCSVVRDRRARRFTLRIDPMSGTINLVAPTEATQREINDFAERHRGWILRHLSRLPPRIPFEPGSLIPIQDEPHEIVSTGTVRGTVSRSEGKLYVPGWPEHTARRVQDHLKAEARCKLTERSHAYAEQAGRAVRSVSVRDTRSRWGSCTSDGRLSFSWRLILAPDWVLSYVAAHEVAHLVEMNHSPGYWRVCRSLFGDVTVPRRWLKANGARLMRYG